MKHVKKIKHEPLCGSARDRFAVTVPLRGTSFAVPLRGHMCGHMCKKFKKSAPTDTFVQFKAARSIIVTIL